MNLGKLVFSQLMSLITHIRFHTCGKPYKGDYKTKHFSCWQQILCIAIVQLSHRESLNDTILCLSANSQKLYHVGIGDMIAKSTLSKDNANCDWRINTDLEVDLNNNLFAIDSTTIDMSLSAFCLAKFHSRRMQRLKF